MKFFIYHHNDFDGIAGAAIFAKFISLKENLIFDDFIFKSVDYHLKENWFNYDLNHPSAIIDFLYHPDCDWWFDHHDSTFQNERHRKHYKHSVKKYWNVKFPSCPSLIISHLLTYFRKYSLQLKKEYKILIQWADVIDSANYKSPRDVYDFNNVYININKTFSIIHDEEYFNIVLRSFFFNDLNILTHNIKFKSALKTIKVKEREAVKIIKKIIKIDNRIAYFDQSNFNIPFQRYLAYYLFPKVLYRVAIFKKEDKYIVSVNYNNWAGKKNKLNLGSLCQKYGGGGRLDVGAVMANNHSTATHIAQNIKKEIHGFDTRSYRGNSQLQVSY